MTTQTPARIPNAIDTGTKLFGRFTMTDVAVALSPAVVISLTIQLLIPPGLTVGGVTVQSAALPLIVAGVVCGTVTVLVTPSYTDSLTWLESIWSYLTGDREQGHTDARELAQVRQIRSDLDAIERSDGALVGMVRVDPASMALATDAEWRQKAAAFENFLNTRIEFPVQFYATTCAVSTEAHLAPYRERLAAESVSPQIAELIEGYVEWFETDVTQRAATIRDQYVVVAVPPRAVQFEPSSVLGELRALPVVGVFVDLWTSEPAAAVRERQAEELRSRLRRVEAGIQGIDDCSARRLGVDETLRVVARYWQDDDAVEAMTVPGSSTPVIGGGEA